MHTHSHTPMHTFARRVRAIARKHPIHPAKGRSLAAEARHGEQKKKSIRGKYDILWCRSPKSPFRQVANASQAGTAKARNCGLLTEALNFGMNAKEAVSLASKVLSEADRDNNGWLSKTELKNLIKKVRLCVRAGVFVCVK